MTWAAFFTPAPVFQGVVRTFSRGYENHLSWGRNQPQNCPQEIDHFRIFFHASPSSPRAFDLGANFTAAHIAFIHIYVLSYGWDFSPALTWRNVRRFRPKATISTWTRIRNKIPAEKTYKMRWKLRDKVTSTNIFFGRDFGLNKWPRFCKKTIRSHFDPGEAQIIELENCISFSLSMKRGVTINETKKKEEAN